MSTHTVPTPPPDPADDARVAVPHHLDPLGECECGSLRAPGYSRPRDAMLCPDCGNYRRNPRTRRLGR